MEDSQVKNQQKYKGQKGQQKGQKTSPQEDFPLQEGFLLQKDYPPLAKDCGVNDKKRSKQQQAQRQAKFGMLQELRQQQDKERVLTTLYRAEGNEMERLELHYRNVRTKYEKLGQELAQCRETISRLEMQITSEPAPEKPAAAKIAQPTAKVAQMKGRPAAHKNATENATPTAFDYWREISEAYYYNYNPWRRAVKNDINVASICDEHKFWHRPRHSGVSRETVMNALNGDLAALATAIAPLELFPENVWDTDAVDYFFDALENLLPNENVTLSKSGLSQMDPKAVGEQQIHLGGLNLPHYFHLLRLKTGDNQPKIIVHMNGDNTCRVISVQPDVRVSTKPAEPAPAAAPAPAPAAAPAAPATPRAARKSMSSAPRFIAGKKQPSGNPFAVLAAVPEENAAGGSEPNNETGGEPNDSGDETDGSSDDSAAAAN